MSLELGKVTAGTEKKGSGAYRAVRDRGRRFQRMRRMRLKVLGKSSLSVYTEILKW